MTYTRGPWYRDAPLGGRVQVVAVGGKTIATVSEQADSSETLDNGRSLGASVAMYAALRRILQVWSEQEDCYCREEMDEAVEEGFRAIKQAMRECPPGEVNP